MKITFDEVPGDVPEINRGAWLRRVNGLLEKAVPGNWAWRTLENDFGFSGDYQEADAGMHWSDNDKEHGKE